MFSIQDGERHPTVSDLPAEEAKVAISLEELKAIWGVNGYKLNDNANLDSKNPETMHKRVADHVTSDAALMLLSPWLAASHLTGDLHIHDLEYFTTRPFCISSDLRYFLYYGLVPDGVGNRLPVAGPARNPEVAILHAAKALGCNQTCFSGGQGFQAFNLFLAPYMEHLPYDQIKQLMQMFIYEMSQMIIARGAQAVFSSVQLVPGVSSIWKDVKAVYMGEVSDRTYGEFEREVRLSFQAFMEIMTEGDYWGKPFNFPKPEISIESDFCDPETWEKPLMEYDDVAEICLLEYMYRENITINQKVIDDLKETLTRFIAPSYRDLYLLAFGVAATNGTPYFDNHLPNYRQSEGGVSCYQCCAYEQKSNAQCDINFHKKLAFKDGYHFDNMGSTQVVSLNLPRAAYKAVLDGKEGEELYQRTLERLIHLIDTAIEIFREKQYYVSKAPLPFARQMPIDPQDNNKRAPPFINIDALGYVIGLVGLNECIQTICGDQLHRSAKARELGQRLVKDLNEYVIKVRDQHGMKIALSRTPAETTAQRFAVADLRDGLLQPLALKVIKGDVNAAIEKIEIESDLPVYYSNGTHLAVDAIDEDGFPISMADKAKYESPYFPLVDGGNIFHIFLGEKSPNPEALMRFGMNLARNTDIGYFTFTRDMTVCKACHQVSPGLEEYCPKCGSSDVDHMSRITGYLQAVSGWNKAKQQELKDRNRINTI